MVGDTRLHAAYVACGGCPSISLGEKWCALDAGHVGEHEDENHESWFLDMEDLEHG